VLPAITSLEFKLVSNHAWNAMTDEGMRAVCNLPALAFLDLAWCVLVSDERLRGEQPPRAHAPRPPPLLEGDGRWRAGAPQHHRPLQARPTLPPPVHGVRRRTADGRMGWAAPRSAERLVLDVYSPNNEFSRRGPDPIQFSIGGAATGCGQHTTGGTIGGGWRDHASARGSAGAV
jgi:hypothetical protein